MLKQPIATLKAVFVPAPDSLMRLQRNRGKANWFMVLNLMWLLWVPGGIIFTPHAGHWFVTVTCATLVVFLVLYASVYLRPIRQALIYALAIAALGYATMPFNSSGGTTYVIYACAMLVFQSTPRRASVMIAGVIAWFVLEATLLHWPWQVTIGMTMVCIAVVGGNMAYWMNYQKDAELRLSHDEVRRLAATAERERIGRDLHDLLGHTLSLITLKLELSRKLFDQDPQAARREITEAENVARHALGEVRAAVTGIRASDLAAELASARLLLESCRVHLDYPSPLPDLPAEIERGLSLVLREASTNIARHAHATIARIELVRDDDCLLMRIVDDGRGGVAADGNGLAGMRERVRALGGDLQIDSPLRRGTTLCVRVALPAAQTAKTAPMESAPVLSSSRPAATLAGGRA